MKKRNYNKNGKKEITFCESKYMYIIEISNLRGNPRAKITKTEVN